MRRTSSHRVEAFDAIVRTHQGAVRTFLRRLTRNSALADELAQETFLIAFRAKTDIDTINNVPGWLLRIAYRQFLDHHRRETRRRDLSAKKSDVEDAPQSHEGTRLDIAQAMDKLPPERRACAMLCLAYGHSHADAAQITGLPLGTVKSHVNRAKTALQKSLSAYRNETAGDAP
ncbi:MAG: RNA polymerase sigma factor [Pseudomonadota bacterium]